MMLKRSTLIFLLMIVVILIINVVVTHNVLTAPYPGHNDFLSRWEPARLFWQEGINPYSDEASLSIQMIIYGRPAGEFDDLGLFVYPFYTVFVLLPLTLVNYAWASAIWMVLLEVFLVLALLLILNLLRWQPPPLMTTTLILWSLLAYFPARGLILGQVGHLVYLLEIAALWGLARDRDRFAAVMLALSTLKPQMGYLLVPFLLLWGLRQRRWQFVGGFIISFGILMLTSFLLVPSWFGEWIAQVTAYPGYTELGGPVWIVANFPWLTIDPTIEKWVVTGGIGHILDPILSLLVYGFLFWTWYEVLIRGKQSRFLWTVVVTLLITHTVAPRTATPHYVVFTLPLIFYLKRLMSMPRRGTLYSLLLLAALFILPWLHFLLTIDGNFEDPTVFLPVPILLGIVLWWTRHLWWQATDDPFQPLPEANGPV